MVDEELGLVPILSHYEVYALLWSVNFFVLVDFVILRGYWSFGKGKLYGI